MVLANNTSGRNHIMLKKTRAVGTLAAVLMTVAVSAAVVRAQTGDVVETAVAAGSFKTLANALDAAGLVTTPKGSGRFTVFAPTDERYGAR
jgi:uncharacterized surface protein with fasciclin (FAS1) repeats